MLYVKNTIQSFIAECHKKKNIKAKIYREYNA